MTASLETVHSLADKVGMNLHGAVTRSEMKRVAFAHFDAKHRTAYAAGDRNLVWMTADDRALLDALEINSFKR